MKRTLIALLVVLMIIAYSPPSLAIVVDGVKSPGEWDEGWAFGQDQNTSHPVPVFPYGDRVEVEQGHGTGIINMEDPPDDSGPDYDETMATIGPNKSGSDLRTFYVHYDPSLDTMYGLSIDYGAIGDLDGDGDIGEQCNQNGDCLGDPGPDGQVGIGPGETFTLRYLQGSAELKLIIGQDNDWQAGLLNLDYEDIDIVWTSEQPDGTDPEPCIEVAISNASKYFNFAYGADPIIVEVTAGGIMDIPGEDTAGFTISIPPCGKLGDYVWLDQDNDGIQDAGENGIANVQVDLYLEGTNTLVGSTTTNSNGEYLFECVSSMDCYDIVLNSSNFNAGGPLSNPNLIASPANVGGNDATDSDGINDRIDNRCLTPDNPVDLTNDFGFYLNCGQIGDYVWFDNNRDGIQDAGENGIANVQVDLYLQGTNTLVDSTTTNSNGKYLFGCVDSTSCYDIVLNSSNFNAGGPLSNLNASPADVGGNDATDSDGINNRTDNRCLTPGNPVDLTNDFGFYSTPIPGLTPFGLFVMAGLLGILGIIGIRMKR